MAETKAPEHNEALLSAVERTLQAHELRLKPGQTLESVIGELNSAGVKLTTERGQLVMENSSGAVIVPRAIERIAETKADLFYPRDVKAVTSRDQLDRAGRVQYITENGLKAYEALPATGAKAAPVELNPRRLTRTQWLSLDRITRAKLSGEWGADAISAIMSRK
jgi:hypothetical protein